MLLLHSSAKGPVIIYGGGGGGGGGGRGGGGGGGTEEKCFSCQKCCCPTIKKSKIWLPNLKYQLKNKYPPRSDCRIPVHFWRPHLLSWYDDTKWNWLRNNYITALL
jgi:hypothetical protein